MKTRTLFFIAIVSAMPLIAQQEPATLTVVAPPEAKPELAFHVGPADRPVPTRRSASCAPAPCRDCGDCVCDQPWNWCGGDFSVWGDLLYWKPMINAFRWAQEEERGTLIRRNFLMRPDLDWGFRVGVGYDRGCSYGQLSYLWFESFDRANLVRAEFILPINLIGVGTQADDFQKVENSLLLRYQNVDLRWGQYLCRSCDSMVSVFGNLRWVDLQRKMRSRGLNATGQTGVWIQNSRFTGAAIGVGASAQFAIWCGFSFVGHLNGMAVIGERKLPANKRNDRGTITVEQYPNDTTVIPAFDSRLGFRFSQGMCGRCVVSLEAGYEVHHYWHALNYTQDGATGIQIVPCQDVGFAGPYLKLHGSY